MISNVAQHKSKNGVLAPYWDSALIEKSASGAVASFADGADGIPMVSVLAQIEPKQSGSGDPSPSNVRPISGWDSVNVTRTGKNLLTYPYEQMSGTVSGVTITVNPDGSVTMVGTPTAGFYRKLQGGYAASAIRLPDWLTIGESYTISSGIPNITQKNVQIMFYDKNGASIGYYRDTTFTVPSNAYYYGIFIYISAQAGALNETFHPMIRLASETDATWESYTAQTYPTTLPQTVYGGTIDVVSGVLTIDTYCMLASSRTWNKSPVANNRINCSLPVRAKPRQCWCSHFKPITSGGMPTADGTIYVNTAAQIIINYRDNVTLEEWNTFIASENVQIAYEMETPQTIQLTPQEVDSLLGDNVLFADSGAVSVVYRADSTLAYNQLTNAIVSLGGNI